MENKTLKRLIKKYNKNNQPQKVASIKQFSNDLETAKKIVQELRKLQARQPYLNRAWQEASDIISLYRLNFGGAVFTK